MEKKRAEMKGTMMVEKMDLMAEMMVVVKDKMLVVFLVDETVEMMAGWMGF